MKHSILFKVLSLRKLHLITLLISVSVVTAQERNRPFILVKAEDRKEILKKIEQMPWAETTYSKLIDKLSRDIELHQTDPEKFLSGLPFDWEKSRPGKTPPFFLTYHIENGEHKNLDNATREEWENGRKLIRYLQTGVDCGIAYYLTEDEKYAQCAIDILNAFVKGVLQTELSDWHHRGGWLFPDDGFREVRDIGYKVPLIYDFIAKYIENGGKPFDLVKKEKTDFPQLETQKVFRTYAKLTTDYGQTGSNHPILEAPSLVYNALAMEDEDERNELLSYFLTENTAYQDALNVMANFYKQEGDIWPETSQYFNSVASILTRLMLIVNRYDPSLKLGAKYSNILFALPALDYMVYPNNEIIRWGDGKRKGRPPYSSYEDAYMLGKMDGSEKITKTFGTLINNAIEAGIYQRNGTHALFFHGGQIEGELNSTILPRTDQVKHAGIFLQRNISPTKKPYDGLMCFVGGAHMVHGHAEGMNIELYGKGEVLGVDNGRGSYQKDIHENYSRIFAAHNTVIVNGSSQSEGGWANLGINTVQLIGMEPMPDEEAVSSNFSFSHTSFKDDKGDKAEAYQERTLALIRTSPTTGYYVDVFRSKSELANEYHDYLYHNIGDELTFENKDLTLSPDPERYMANASGEWIQNRKFRHPGWHFFNDVQTSGIYAKDVKALFTISKLERKKIYMGLHIPGFQNRQYTKVAAPNTYQAPEPYQNFPTPTLLIRKNGEAWDEPFVVVYEPFDGRETNNSVVEVKKLFMNDVYAGVKVISKVEGAILIQYVLTCDGDQEYDCELTGIKFVGSFAVITTREDGTPISLYMGSGQNLSYKNISIVSDISHANAFLDLSGSKPEFKSKFENKVKYELHN